MQSKIKKVRKWHYTRTEECDNACYLPFWVTNPLITKCKVATRNPGPILHRCKSHDSPPCLPNHDHYSRGFTGGSKSGQDSVLGPRILRISPQKGWFEYLWPRPLAAAWNGVRPGPGWGKWRWVCEKRRPQQYLSKKSTVVRSDYHCWMYSNFAA